MTTAWDDEPGFVGEETFTPWGEGWYAWNERSPEVEFVEFVGALTAMIRPMKVIETGVGQGFTTRRVMDNLPDAAVIHVFEGYEPLRDQIPVNEQLIAHVDESPQSTDYAGAGLVILDSFWSLRLDELRAFADHGDVGAVVVVHDVADRGAGPVQEMFKAEVDRLQGEGLLTGAFLPNPRGSYIGTRT